MASKDMTHYRKGHGYFSAGEATYPKFSTKNLICQVLSLSTVTSHSDLATLCEIPGTNPTVGYLFIFMY